MQKRYYFETKQEARKKQEELLASGQKAFIDNISDEPHIEIIGGKEINYNFQLSINKAH